MDQKKKLFLGSPAFRLIGLGTAALVVIAAFLAYFVYHQVANGRTASAKLSALQDEFAQIPAPPDAVRIRHDAVHKINQGDVGADYKIAGRFDDIRIHYDRELKARGWTFAKEENVKIWNQNFGGKQLFYCKDGNTATLEYAGAKEAEFGWTYSFGLSWGLFDECN